MPFGSSPFASGGFSDPSPVEVRSILGGTGVSGLREYKHEFEPAVLDGTSTTRRPDAVVFDHLRAFSLGPVALQDPSEGVFDYVWYSRVDNAAGEVHMARETDAGDGWQPETLQFTFDPADPILESDLAFNQNGDPVICVERATGPGGASEVWIYFFDPTAGVSGDQVLNNYGAGRNPRALLDAPRDTDISDVLVFYFSDATDDLVYRRQRDRYDTELVTGLGSADDRFLEEVVKRSDTRLGLYFTDHAPSPGTYSLSQIVSALFRYTAGEEGVEPAQEPLSGFVETVILQIAADTDDPSQFEVISGFDETEGVEAAQEPLSGLVKSVVINIVAETDDATQFNRVEGFTETEGVKAIQDPRSGAVAQVLLLAIADTEDPADFGNVNAFTETEGVQAAQDPQSGAVVDVVIEAFNQPIEGVDAVQEPISGSVTAV